MTVEISSAPGQFPALIARMLRLELEAAGIAVSESSEASDALFIYVDASGGAELRRQKQRDNQKAAPDDRFFKYPFRSDAFVAAVVDYLYESARDKTPQIIAKPQISGPGGRAERRVRLKFFDGERRVEINGAAVRLTEREYKLFRCLYEHRGNAVGRPELAEIVWDGKSKNETNVVEVYISYLRRKLEDASGERLIITRRGRGYELKC